MRGLEAALAVYSEVRGGAFASEALRKIYQDIAPKDRKLAATLLYCALRRQSLWRTMLLKYCRRSPRELPPLTWNALILGIAGIVELRRFALPALINGLVQAVKAHGGEKDVGLVNAVLHTIAGESNKFLEELRRSSALRDQALYWGVPGWAAAQWAKEHSIQEAKRLVRLSGMKRYLSLRLSHDADKEEYLKEYNSAGRLGWPSPFIERAVRTSANPFPLELPGFAEGKIMVQSESSMAAAEILASRARGGYLLDMCCGRGVKTGQLADIMKEARIEAWDISKAKIKAAKGEMERLKVSRRVKFKHGDARKLAPDEAPDTILLDAPCSGSGTWGRHPESKWRCSPEQVEANGKLERALLERAVNLLAPGGVIMYSTCSLFRTENEQAVADVVSRHPELVELPIECKEEFMRRGRPYGTVVLPALPWVDGFYMAMLAKRRQSVAEV